MSVFYILFQTLSVASIQKTYSTFVVPHSHQHESGLSTSWVLLSRLSLLTLHDRMRLVFNSIATALVVATSTTFVGCGVFPGTPPPSRASSCRTAGAPPPPHGWQRSPLTPMLVGTALLPT